MRAPIPTCAAVLLLLAWPARLALAQPFWMPWDSEQAVLLEYLAPSIEGVDQTIASCVFFLSMREEVSHRVAVVGEFPYANFDATIDDKYESGSAAGNMYIGIEAASGWEPAFWEAGFRIPMAEGGEGEAMAFGLLSDITRWDAFQPHALFLQSAFNLQGITDSQIEYRVRLSPVVQVATESGFYRDDAELFGVYAWSIGYHGRLLRIGTALSGRVLVTDDSGNLGERTWNQLELHLDVGSWAIRPGVDFRLPLGWLSEEVPVVLGASVSWSQ